MADQAEKLREMIAKAKKERESQSKKEQAELKQGDARIIAFSSGKGGVGKTNICLNLAISLSKQGKKVCVIDADLGMANIDVLLGINPKYNLFHLVNDERSLDDILVQGPCGVQLVSGGSGIRELANLSEIKLTNLIKNFSLLNKSVDYIFIDTGAGLSESVLCFVKAASDLFLIVTPDPASITDAYALLKNAPPEQENVSIIVNRVESSVEADIVFNRLQAVSQRFLGLEISKLGYVLEDSSVKGASKRQKPFYIDSPKSSASNCINLISHRIDKNEDLEINDGRFSNFIKSLFGK